MKTSKDKFERYQFKLRLFFDILATLLAWFLAYYLRFFVLPGARRDSFDFFLIMSPVAVISTLVALFGDNLYESKITTNRQREAEGIFKVSIISFLAFVVIYYYFVPVTISRIALGLYGIFLTFFLFTGRSIAHEVIRRKVKSGLFLQRTLLFGFGNRLEEYYTSTVERGDAERNKFIGQYGGDEPIKGIAQLEGESLEDVVKRNNIDIVVISFPNGSDKREAAIDECLDLLGATVLLLPNIPNSYVGSKITDLHSIPAIRLNSSDLSPGKRFVKRTFDLVSCSIAVVLLSPLYLLLALLVKISSKGPVFFKQERVTREGKVFKMLKFRSMRIDMPEQNGPHWTEENDPRITKIGKLLRKTSLDELPQFFNVIEGSMSLVGPRPERPELVEQFKKEIPGYAIRHKVKAGITGWAQVNGLRGNTSIQKRVAYDLNYVQNWSFLFDFKIVILTFFKGFINKNAY